MVRSEARRQRRSICRARAPNRHWRKWDCASDLAPAEGHCGRATEEGAFLAPALAAVALQLGGLAVELERLLDQRRADAGMIFLGHLPAIGGTLPEHCGTGHCKRLAKLVSAGKR